MTKTKASRDPLLRQHADGSMCTITNRDFLSLDSEISRLKEENKSLHLKLQEWMEFVNEVRYEIHYGTTLNVSDDDLRAQLWDVSLFGFVDILTDKMLARRKADGVTTGSNLTRRKIDSENKLECMLRSLHLRMVADSIRSHAEFGPNEHRKDAPPFEAIHGETANIEINRLSEKNKSLQENINCKQQSINQLTAENRKQLDKINSLLHEATDKKSLENELKSLKTQLKNSAEQSEILKKKMENQRAELKNLNTKSNQVSLLNAEIARLKSQLEARNQLIHDANGDLNTCKTKIQQLEQEISQYEEILNDLDNSPNFGTPKEESVENSSQECAICCEVFSEDRKRVGYGPCGHSMACVECSETMLRKTTANVVRGRKSANCPICRTEIESTIILQGIY